MILFTWQDIRPSRVAKDRKPRYALLQLTPNPGDYRDDSTVGIGPTEGGRATLCCSLLL